MDVQVRLVCIPSTDTDFAAHARSVLSTIPAQLGEAETRRELERRLRRFYPGAVVRPRDPLASFGPAHEVVWYATNRSVATAIHESVEIPAPRDLVYDVYLERYPEWQTAVAVTPAKPPTSAVLAAYDAVYEILGRRFVGRFDVVEVSRPAFVRVEATATSGIEVWYVTSFRESSGGTVVEVIGDYHLPARFLPEVQRFIVDRMIAQDIRRAHRSLVDLVARQRAARAEGAPKAG
ncbi:MAG TPA: SRPBCC family protein [Candidatus Limnocylindrales bacterium]|nr:SRPBCC family protein [Candidatus Limnocylindrales bacterium]